MASEALVYVEERTPTIRSTSRCPVVFRRHERQPGHGVRRPCVVVRTLCETRLDLRDCQSKAQEAKLGLWAIDQAITLGNGGGAHEAELPNEAEAKHTDNKKGGKTASHLMHLSLLAESAQFLSNTYKDRNDGVYQD